MGIDADFPMAFAKALLGAGQVLPRGGTVFLSVRDADKSQAASLAASLNNLGCKIISTRGTADYLARGRIKVEVVPKIQEGLRPNIIDRIKNGEVNLIINTPTGRGPRLDEAKMRMAAVMHDVPVITTMSAARAAVSALGVLRERKMGVKALQEYHGEFARNVGAL
ncbi:MAG: hypothetical protein ACYTAN_11145 [Planctomycetota bacterium]